MRKSRIKNRLLTAGLTTGVVGAALLAAPTAALAVDFTSVLPAAGPSGTVVTLSGNSIFPSSPVGVILTTLSACPTTYTTTAAAPAFSVAVATTTRVDASKVTFTVPAAATLNAGLLREYAVCSYNGNVATSALINDASTPKKFTLLPNGTVTPVSGPSGGGNPINITVPPGDAFKTHNSIVFTPRSEGCTATYGSPDTSRVAAVTVNAGSTTQGTVTVPPGVGGALANPTAYNLCLFTNDGTVVSGTVIDAVITPYSVSLPPITLNTAIGGPGSNTAAVTASSTADFLTGITAPAALIMPQTTQCPTVYETASGSKLAADVFKSANNRAAVKLPSGVTVSPIPYNICIYSSNATSDPKGRIIGNTTYIAATPPDVTAIIPAAGSSLGGELITVTGSGFPGNPAMLSATLGGLPLTNINVLNPNTFTAITPSHAGELDVPLVIRTETGSKTVAAAFDYLNAISVMPNTASNRNDNVWVNIKGVGFENYTWDTNAYAVAGDVEPRVWLLDGSKPCTDDDPLTCPQSAYAPAGGGAWTAGGGPRAECSSVVTISGNEIFCKLNLKTGALLDTSGAAQTDLEDKVVPNGTYSLTVVSNGSPNAVSPTVSVVSSGSTFTVADF